MLFYISAKNETSFPSDRRFQNPTRILQAILEGNTYYLQAACKILARFESACNILASFKFTYHGGCPSAQKTICYICRKKLLAPISQIILVRKDARKAIMNWCDWRENEWLKTLLALILFFSFTAPFLQMLINLADEVFVTTNWYLYDIIYLFVLDWASCVLWGVCTGQNFYQNSIIELRQPRICAKTLQDKL